MNKINSEEKELENAKAFLDNMLSLLSETEKKQLLKNLLEMTKNI